mmetsp:Transcript_24840/g.81265  ORF Transcript_24840/g.81265 Transcript_24840/m.81265 type:complete len:251 (+) Transcript_24840:598-1350(+)
MSATARECFPSAWRSKSHLAWSPSNVAFTSAMRASSSGERSAPFSCAISPCKAASFFLHSALKEDSACFWSCVFLTSDIRRSTAAAFSGDPTVSSSLRVSATQRSLCASASRSRSLADSSAAAASAARALTPARAFSACSTCAWPAASWRSRVAARPMAPPIASSPAPSLNFSAASRISPERIATMRAASEPESAASAGPASASDDANSSICAASADALSAAAAADACSSARARAAARAPLEFPPLPPFS